MTEGGAGMTEGGAGDQGRRVPPPVGRQGMRVGGSHGNEEGVRRLRGRRAVGRFGAWLMGWWSHGFLPAQE